MKSLAAVLVIFSLLGLNSIDSVEWKYNLENAILEAKKTDKPVLVYFTGSDWCGPCKALSNDFFNSEEFKKRAHEIILVKLDIPRRVDLISTEQLAYNREKLKSLNPSKKFPTVIALNKKGKEMSRKSGYSSSGSPEAYLNMLSEILKD